jgi:hypothetical protein
MTTIMKNVKLRLDKIYDIDHLTEENFWKRKEPKYVLLTINIKDNTMLYAKEFRFGLYHIRKVNYIRRILIWKIQVKKILHNIRPLNIDLIQHLLFKFIGCPDPYFETNKPIHNRTTYCHGAYTSDLSSEFRQGNYLF